MFKEAPREARKTRKGLMSVPLRSERSRGLAAMQRDKAPVEWPRSEGGDPTEGSMLGRLLWKPTLKRGLLHESHLQVGISECGGIVRGLAICAASPH